MDNRLFLNSDVSRIIGITPRQVLAWSEKGLIVPSRETIGAGTKRGYNYVNLLEICLCRHFFNIGMGIQTIKKILNYLRSSQLIQEWASNFNNYFIKRFIANKEHFQSQIEELIKSRESEVKIREFKQLGEKIYNAPDVPNKPVGILMILYSNEGENIILIPWDMDYAIGLNDVKKALTDSVAIVIVDLGKIKLWVDLRI